MNMDEGILHLLNSGSNRPNGNYWSTISFFSPKDPPEINKVLLCLGKPFLNNTDEFSEKFLKKGNKSVILFNILCRTLHLSDSRPSLIYGQSFGLHQPLPKFPLIV